MQEENDRQRRRIQLPMDSSASQAQRQNDNQPPWRQEKCKNSRAGLQSSGKRLILKWAFSPGFTDASAKAHHELDSNFPERLSAPTPA
jgi:hypothetical protein